ncbi:MAG: CHAT domain-containing protein [Gemmatimonadetes bacterium]|nr:CHAT domain-containing protein [Gemmatimonadota bacterium]
MSESRKSHFLERLIHEAAGGDITRILDENPDRLQTKLVVQLRDQAADLVRRDPSAALALSTLAMKIAERVPDKLAKAWAYRTSAETRFLSGRLLDALPDYEQCVAIFEAHGEEHEGARTKVGWMNLLAMTGQAEKALAIAGTIPRVLKRHDDHDYLAKYFMNLGNIHLGREEHADALGHYDTADGYFEKGGAPPVTRIGLYVNRATAFAYLDRFEDAVLAYEQARSAARDAGAEHLAAQITHNLGHAYLLASRLQDALHSLQQARAAFESVEDDLEVAKCDLNRSEAYLRLNMPKEAFELAGGCAEVFAANAVAGDHAIALSNRGKASWGMGDAEAGAESLRKAYALFVREKNTIRASIAACQLVFLYQERGDTREADRWLSRVREARGKHTVASALVMADLAEAAVAAAKGEADVALAVLGGARRRARRVANPLLAIQIDRLAGDLYESRGDTRSAVRAWGRAAQTVDEMRVELGSDLFRVSFLGSHSDLYDRMLEAASRAGRPDNARLFQLAESARSRALLDQMDAKGASGDADAGRLQTLESRLSWLRSRFDTVSVESGDSDRLHRLRERIRDCESKIAREGMRTEEGIRGAAAGAKEISYEECRRALGVRETGVYYVVLQKSIFALVFNRETSRRVALDITPVEVTKLAARLRRHLEQFSMPASFLARRMSRLESDADRILRELGDALWSPLARYVKTRRVVVFPHRMLHGLPIPALLPHGEALLQRHSFRYGLAFSIDRHLRNARGADNGTALLKAFPQPGSETVGDEIRAIRRELSRYRLARSGKGARGMLRALAEADVVHIATHGEFRADNPQFSAISLGEENLYLYQLRQARMNPSLVTLSACQSGQSFVENGDELVGMMRGFLAAGARAMLASYWKVDDRATTRLMSRFYRSLSGGARKSEALAAAMDSIRDESPHPYYWAPFALVGSDAPLQRKALD